MAKDSNWLTKQGYSKSHAEWWLKKAQQKPKEASKASPIAQPYEERIAQIDLNYAPTKTSNLSDPRTSAAGYDSDLRVLVVEFDDNGAHYAYENVSPGEWAAFKRSSSPGKYINRVLNAKRYYRIGE